MAKERPPWPMFYPGWGEHFAARVAIELKDSRRRTAAAETGYWVIGLGSGLQYRPLPGLPRPLYLHPRPPASNKT